MVIVFKKKLQVILKNYCFIAWGRWFQCETFINLMGDLTGVKYDLGIELRSDL